MESYFLCNINLNVEYKEMRQMESIGFFSMEFVKFVKIIDRIFKKNSDPPITFSESAAQ